MTYYVGLLEGDDETWSVRIPDFGGVHGGGNTADAAISDTISALQTVAAMLLSQGKDLPPARPLETVLKDPATEFGLMGPEASVMIPLIVDRGRPVRANISMDAGVLAAIDAEAKRRGLTRSAFLTSAALDKIVKG